ncbi:MAG TPA: hypothetical protein PLP20_02395, partial [Oscillospiraceae bacterium]|nr:hypothetical protein [Oscillospiraceae bacterium]
PPGGATGATGPAGATGATGPEGEAGAVGATGATGATGWAGRPSAAAFSGAEDFCWKSGCPLPWSETIRSPCSCVHLSSDRAKIILPAGKSYLADFFVNLKPAGSGGGSGSLCLRLLENGREKNLFTYYFPLCRQSPVLTVSAAGISVPANSCASARLALILGCPDSVEVESAGLSLIEI